MGPNSQSMTTGMSILDLWLKIADMMSEKSTKERLTNHYRTKIAVRGMAEGWFTGVSLSSYDRPDGDYDFYSARAIINWPGAQGGEPRQQAGNLGIDFARILASHCPRGGTSAGIVCRAGP
jgi:hypothetical protein